MTEEEKKREDNRLQEIQKERERLAREMENEVQRIRTYIMLGANQNTSNTKLQ